MGYEFYLSVFIAEISWFIHWTWQNVFSSPVLWLELVFPLSNNLKNTGKVINEGEYNIIFFLYKTSLFISEYHSMWISNIGRSCEGLRIQEFRCGLDLSLEIHFIAHWFLLGSEIKKNLFHFLFRISSFGSRAWDIILQGSEEKIAI